jgi:D-glycero-beta-D-manno-heptose-7-phosphate kinase
MTVAEILAALPAVRILVIGDLMLDHYIWGDVHRISPEAPVPVVQANRDTYTAGGAANVTLNLASLNVQATLFGTLGNDSHGDILTKILDAAHINSTHCIRSANTETIVKTRVIVRTQQLCRIDREGPRSHYAFTNSQDIENQLDSLVKEADAIILSDYAKGVITQQLLDQVSRLAAKHGRLLAIDPKPSRHLDFKNAGLITPNRHEALELANLPEPAANELYPLAEACLRIHQKIQPALLVITLGAEGMAVCQNGQVIATLPTRAREVFDVSGAGDTVIATLAAALAAGAAPVAAAHFANLAAGIVVSKVGTATASRAEVAAALEIIS